MSAQSVDTFVLDFSDPNLSAESPERVRVNASASFELFLNQNIRTLSTNTASNGEEIEGLLYVPNLDPSDPCTNTSSQYIPRNVTRRTDLPSSEYLYVAFAPWISANCTRSYLTAAHDTRAFIFYIPGNSTDIPPPMSDPTWDLQDGGSWKTQNPYPVYAVPGANGQTIMNELSEYSGNMSQVPNGNQLLQQYDSTDYVRLYTTFGTSAGSGLPTLWAFLLIVLAIVIILIGATSLSMHYVQRRRRRALQRRVDEGTIDLESLGIKRLKVPQSAVDALPLTLYDLTSPPEKDPSIQSLETSSCPSTSCQKPTYNQPTCPICLDDFTPNATTIRTLPCAHIYHPACIDPFLLSNSSLCPVCKAKVIPKGQCAEPITNAMVRRERHLRHLRAIGPSVAVHDSGTAGWAGRLERHFRGSGNLIGTAVRSTGLGRRVFTVPVVSRPSESQMEMGSVGLGGMAGTDPAPLGRRAATDPVPAVEPASPPPLTADLERRREWARARASALLGQLTVVDVDEEDRVRRAGMPKWRKALSSVFPGFR